MNNEIKEILDKLKDIHNFDYSEECDGYNNLIKKEYDIYLSKKETDLLLDYITNLQKTNKNHSKKLIELGDKITNLQQENDYYFKKNNELSTLNTSLRNARDDYKSRCEKASDKLGNYRHYLTPTEEQNSENEDIVDSALNILQNGSENNE